MFVQKDLASMLVEGIRLLTVEPRSVCDGAWEDPQSDFFEAVDSG